MEGFVPFEYEFRVELRPLRIRWSGDVEDADLLTADQELRTHPEFDRDFDVLVDFSAGSSRELSRSGILQVVARPPALSSKSRRAFVVSDDPGFGLGRMFEQMRGADTGETLICRDLDEAEHWLAREAWIASARRRRDPGVVAQKTGPDSLTWCLVTSMPIMPSPPILPVNVFMWGAAKCASSAP